MTKHNPTQRSNRVMMRIFLRIRDPGYDTDHFQKVTGVARVKNRGWPNMDERSE